MTLKQITPFVPCTSLNAQIAFYRDILGFAVGFQADNYAFLKRDAVAIRLVEVWSEVDLKHPEREWSFYIDVEGIDDLYESDAPSPQHVARGSRLRAIQSGLWPTRVPRQRRRLHADFLWRGGFGLCWLRTSAPSGSMLEV